MLYNDSCYCSQWKQDKIIYETFFKDRPASNQRVCVDVGAHDGLEGSNSYFFEKELGWKCILIEPLKDVFSKLVRNRNSKNSFCFNVACYSDLKPVEFTVCTGYTELLSGINSEYNEQHLKRIEKELKQYGGEKETVVVPAMPLQLILESCGVRIIDLLSVDVEGGEMSVLQGINFEKTSIGIITIEANYDEDANKLKTFLGEKGFIFSRIIGGDLVFHNHNFIEKYIPSKPVVETISKPIFCYEK